MAKIERSEDIEGWKRARVLTRRIYLLTNVGDFARDFGLRDQIRRASVSIVSNVAEGFDRGGCDKEFARYLSIAKGSAGEVRSQLYVALDVGYLLTDEFNGLTQQVTEISRLLRAFMQDLSPPG